MDCISDDGCCHVRSPVGLAHAISCFLNEKEGQGEGMLMCGATSKINQHSEERLEKGRNRGFHYVLLGGHQKQPPFLVFGFGRLWALVRYVVLCDPTGTPAHLCSGRKRGKAMGDSGGGATSRRFLVETQNQFWVVRACSVLLLVCFGSDCCGDASCVPFPSYSFTVLILRTKRRKECARNEETKKGREREEKKKKKKTE